MILLVENRKKLIKKEFSKKKRRLLGERVL
jgi:hypothetical protein